jgi:2-oxoglutarate ferredoxin oxidoreductase subunit alpha
MQDLTLAFVGSGGDGAIAAGDIVASACAGQGLHIIKTDAYGPQIRGGESSSTVRISGRPIHAQGDAVDVLVVFSWADFARFRDEIVLTADAVIFYESGDEPPALIGSRLLYGVPFAALARESGAAGAKNVLALGLVAATLALPLDAMRDAITRRFSKKSAAVIESNLRIFDRGVLEAENLGPLPIEPFTYQRGTSRLLMSGNEATAFGAVHAGCRFFAGYPITPSTEILHFLGEWLPRVGGSALQTEDELSAIGATIGASFAGAKAMTATSGPGLSLMAELLGLASIAEIPTVVVDVQRGGPSTGLPTKSEQSDLFQALYASHGDTPRVVIACSDVEESFHVTVDAFNIAEEYQLPVIVLSDQSIAQRKQTVDEASLEHEVRGRRYPAPDELADYERYRTTPDGVSPMSVPGMAGGVYQTNGLEHDADGRPSASFLTHEAMNAKRFSKIEAVRERYALFHRFGAERPEVGVICWGSSVGVLREALGNMGDDGRRVGVFAPVMLAPLPRHNMQTFIESCDSILVVELSYSGQFHQYLLSQVDLPRRSTTLYSRSGGKPLSSSEIVAALQPLLVANRMEVFA